MIQVVPFARYFVLSRQPLELTNAFDLLNASFLSVGLLVGLLYFCAGDLQLMSAHIVGMVELRS